MICQNYLYEAMVSILAMSRNTYLKFIERHLFGRVRIHLFAKLAESLVIGHEKGRGTAVILGGSWTGTR